MTNFTSNTYQLKREIVVLLYSSSLRAGEVRRLKYKDIQRRNMRIHITHGKNRADRYAILSKKALDILSDYWLSCGKPKDWLFPKIRKDRSKPIDHFYLPRRIARHEQRLG